MTKGRLYLGPAGLVYAVVSLLLLGAAIFTQANLLFWGFGAMVGGMLASLLFSCWIMRGVRVERLTPSHGVVGEAMPLRYRVHNTNRKLPLFNLILHEAWGTRRADLRAFGRRRRSMFGRGETFIAPPGIAGSQAANESGGNLPAGASLEQDHTPRLAGRPHAWLLHVPPGKSAMVTASCYPLRRGVLELQRVVVTCTFPFGVVRRIIVHEQCEHVIVYPALFRMQRELLPKLAVENATGHMQQSKAGGHDEFFGLRPYRVGDSPRVIHWKHSARMGELISKEMTQSSPPRIMMLLDLTEARLAAAEEATGRGRSRSMSGRKGRGPVSHDDDAPPRPSDITAASGDRRDGEVGNDDASPRMIIERAVSLAASLICDAHLHGYEMGMVVRGGKCERFKPHHSTAHRTRMLEALALMSLDIGDQGSNLERELKPTVVVRADMSDPFAATSATAHAASGNGDVIHPDQARRDGHRARGLASGAERGALQDGLITRSRSGAIVLRGSLMDHYVYEADGGSHALLQRRPHATADATHARKGRFGVTNMSENDIAPNDTTADAASPGSQQLVGTAGHAGNTGHGDGRGPA